MNASDYLIRPFEESDRAAAEALGQHVIDWWNRECLTLHLVATSGEGGPVVAHLQIADRSFPEPSRRKGECQLRLTVSSDHRRRGLGGALFDRAERFARDRGASRVTTSYFECPAGEPAAAFLSHRGFVPFERYCPSHLDLAGFDPGRFAGTVARVERQGIRLFTYADVEDAPSNRRRLYDLEAAARAVQPFREVGQYEPTPYEEWEQERAGWSPDTVFLAAAPDDGPWIGMISGLEWGFTGVHPDWQGRGIATALKVRALAAAKARGMVRIDTENHEDNRAMLAINRKLGFAFDPVEVNCVRLL